MKVNFSDENDNESFLSNYPSDRAYPHFYVLERDGTFLHSQGTGELEQGTGYNEQVFADFLDRWRPLNLTDVARGPVRRLVSRNRLFGGLLIEWPWFAKTTIHVCRDNCQPMSETPKRGTSESPAPGRGWGFLVDLPWERITMWLALGLLLYVMRDFFLVIFMTFLLCYFVRRMVNVALAWLPPGRRTVWFDRGITIMVFVALLAAFVGLLGTLVPKIVEQSRTVFFKIEHAEWQVEFDGLLRRTVGEYLWRRSFGNAADSRYQEALVAIARTDRPAAGSLRLFPRGLHDESPIRCEPY